MLLNIKINLFKVKKYYGCSDLWIGPRLMSQTCKRHSKLVSAFSKLFANTWKSIIRTIDQIVFTPTGNALKFWRHDLLCFFYESS